MPNLTRILQKIEFGGVLTLAEVEAILTHWGFVRRAGKGSHVNWKHPTAPKILTIATHSKEVPRYVTRLLRKFLEEL